MDISSSSSGITKGRKSSHTFQWVISNFETRYISSPCEDGIEITGPTFPVTHPDGNSLTSWTLRVGLDDKNESMSAFLALVSCPAEYLHDGLICSFQIYLDHQSGTAKLGHRLKALHRYKTISSFGWSKFISVKELKAKSLACNDTLRVRVELSMFAEELESTITSATCDSTAGSLILQSHMSFESMLENQDLSDITVACGCETFPAHKAILGGRSKVFKTMLTSDMEEVKSGLIKVTDMTPSTFQQILRYIYTGGVGDDTDSEDLLELTYGAKKYGLDDLKKYCVTKFVVYVTEESVGSLLIAAHL